MPAHGPLSSGGRALAALRTPPGGYLSHPQHGDRPGAHAHAAPPPRHTATSETLAAMPTPLREDLPEAPHMLSRLELLNQLGPEFAKTPLRKVAPGRDGELLFQAASDHSLAKIIAEGFLRPPRAGVPACHRLAVFDFASGAAAERPAIRVTGVLSQTDVIRWLGALIQAGGAGAFPRATIASLGLSPKAVVSVSAQEPTIDAFAKLLAAGLPAAAVLAAPGGAVVASLALADLTGILADKLGVLALPVGEFLALRYGTVWASASATAAPPSPGGGAAPLARRDVLMQQRALVAVRPDATIQQASLGYFP